MQDAILTLNAGSSSVKFALFAGAAESGFLRVCAGSVDRIGDARARFVGDSFDAGGGTTGNTTQRKVAAGSHGAALQIILDWLEDETSGLQFVAAGHRVVHGGTVFYEPVRLDAVVLARLKALIPLAPLHQPHALQAIEALQAQRPNMPQVACFDTAFHASRPPREQHLALPRALAEEEGIRSYGFHGLSYEYIAGELPSCLAGSANGRVVIAHLGHGVSMCALENGQSIATTMSFTPLDGLPMGTRCGAIDPAIVLHLLERGMSASDIADLLHHRSGLLGLSGISGDMRTLLASPDPAAAEAVDFFCYRVSRELGSLAAALGGLDAVVFTGGIGEHAAPVRAAVCRTSAWLGVEIDAQANEAHALQISTPGSRVSVWVIPTDEEQVIARHTAALLASGPDRPGQS
jgi:acetate kinase